ncbi:hypothetical protein ILYODFUR_029956 [Ilyodon furcidens]|uniref:Uncharacterized protein n=1 Tax=Ilyodon furcidens TaxID=33524 RepID=A0ABV0TZY9_9TELE
MRRRRKEEGRGSISLVFFVLKGFKRPSVSAGSASLLSPFRAAPPWLEETDGCWGRAERMQGVSAAGGSAAHSIITGALPIETFHNKPHNPSMFCKLGSLFSTRKKSRMTRLCKTFKLFLYTLLPNSRACHEEG